MRLPARPFVSFIMATYNRGAIVLDCLEKTLATARTSLGQDHFNIHIVDNASTDGTLQRLSALAESNPHIRLHRQSTNCGPVAKNIALHDNPADLIVLLDDDAYPMPGALGQMVRHFQDDPHLGAAVFDVTLPDGRKEASAYPDVFIGAGTALRGKALREVASRYRDLPGRGFLPADYFMQAEEYDLAFRFLEHGWSVQRFWDMPLMHLKAPGARIGQRTTRLDVRNNLFLLARYLPASLAAAFAADWLARYWRMAVRRDSVLGTADRTHKGAFTRGAAEGLLHWPAQSSGHTLSAGTLEKIFKFDAIRTRLARATQQKNIRRIVLGDWGKNTLPFYQAAQALQLEVLAVVDDQLAPEAGAGGLEYRGVPVVNQATFLRDFQHADAIVLTQISRVHAQRRAAEIRRTVGTPLLDLFAPAAVNSSAPSAMTLAP